MKVFVGQLLRYYGVSGLAALTHFAIVFSLVELFGFKPEVANVFAFFCAFSVNYLGQLRVTFASKSHNVLLALILLASFAINQTLFIVFRHLFSLHYLVLLGLAVVCSSLIAFPLGRKYASNAT